MILSGVKFNSAWPGRKREGAREGERKMRIERDRQETQLETEEMASDLYATAVLWSDLPAARQFVITQQSRETKSIQGE